MYNTRCFESVFIRRLH